MEIITLITLLLNIYVVAARRRPNPRLETRRFPEPTALHLPFRLGTNRSPASKRTEHTGRSVPKEIEMLMEPFRADATVWKALAARIVRHATAAARSGRIDKTLVAEARAALPLVNGREGELTQLNDRLFFARKTSSDRFHKYVEASPTFTRTSRRHWTRSTAFGQT